MRLKTDPLPSSPPPLLSPIGVLVNNLSGSGGGDKGEGEVKPSADHIEMGGGRSGGGVNRG